MYSNLFLGSPLIFFLQSGGDIPIAVSKKCCFLCWLLHKLLNRDGNWNFQLRGTHSTIYAWIPPPGLPEDILMELCNELIKVLRNGASCSVTRQSSYDSLHSNPQEFPDLDQSHVTAFKSKFVEYREEN